MTVSYVAPGSLGNPDIDYNKAFEGLARHVKSAGLTAPRPRYWEHAGLSATTPTKLRSSPGKRERT